MCYQKRMQEIISSPKVIADLVNFTNIYSLNSQNCPKINFISANHLYSSAIIVDQVNILKFLDETYDFQLTSGEIVELWDIALKSTAFKCMDYIKNVMLINKFQEPELSLNKQRFDFSVVNSIDILCWESILDNKPDDPAKSVYSIPTKKQDKSNTVFYEKGF